LNDYLERCWDIVRSFDEFNIRHIFCFENSRANGLAQEALGYQKSEENSMFLEI
jgi:hypothetical protein